MTYYNHINGKERYWVQPQENGLFAVYSDSTDWAEREEIGNLHSEEDAIDIAKEFAGIKPEFDIPYGFKFDESTQLITSFKIFEKKFK